MITDDVGKETVVQDSTKVVRNNRNPKAANLWCLKKDLPCHGTTQYYSLFINCGGPKIEAGGKEYEEDFVTEGESYLHPTDRWAYSSTSVFMYNDRSNLVSSNTNVTTCE
ncbi:hypothetical protein POM88_012837 [Heracleum sosnowskyi]|uniref:Uncharacterized protein n=1 Tax=Heracleum sosnowskyi TaxID=360622 RepID=A0AAD8N2P2_9APIA|nr:hypothetical protein POM88_012837 [Heracleum sosnowskyi]